MEDDEVEDEGGRNKNKPDGRKMEKDQCRRSDEASNLKDQIASMMKAKEAMVARHLEVKVSLAEKKNQGKEKKWARRCTFEDRKISIEKEQMKADKRAEENRLMMLDPNSMEPMQREFWELTRS